MPETEHAEPRRPCPSRYDSPGPFVRDMLRHLRATEPGYSLRRECASLRRCSIALVTLIAQGKRRLAPDRIPELAKALRLTARERQQLARLTKECDELPCGNALIRQRAGDALLRPWYHAYLFEAVRLRGFSPEPAKLFTLLRGLVDIPQLRRGLRVLLQCGFLRRTLEGHIVQTELSFETSDEVSSREIRMLHKKSLSVAARLLDEIPLEEREADLIFLTLNREKFAELKRMMKEFAQNVTAFAEENSSDDEVLYQVVLNVSPLSQSDCNGNSASEIGRQVRFARGSSETRQKS